ncbi:MAG: TrkA family potassium uptake protein [Desulfarculaceae bacterium]|nr:TrkA family potassium uptake protein [Desulfarculaceae bacterium]MCF8072521.1 TrkA family potassium uptake protein [Desulfarculaceae bacterium]MCF8103662.1 TrkA family potassium uptake protein [Desulfarculaceae bacterium]MCF8117062.1 TrkA family potassium uptake protein [Desulfarculaceae bacterium]
MNLAVIGLGQFGSSLARELKTLKHHVTAIDSDPKAVSRVQDVVDQAVVADAIDRNLLEELGLNLVDAAVISLGDNLGASILITLHLKEMGVGRIVAKAISPEHEKILKRIGAGEVVFPERDAAERLSRSLTDPNLLDYLPIGDEFSVAELAPPDPLVGKSLSELGLRKNYGVNVIAIRELVPERIHLVVAPDYVVKDSDVLVVAGRQEDLERLRSAK